MNSKEPATNGHAKNGPIQKADEGGTSLKWESPPSAATDQQSLATENEDSPAKKKAGRQRKTIKIFNEKFKKYMKLKNNRALINEMNIKPEYFVFQDGFAITCNLKVDGIDYPSMGRGNTKDAAKDDAISNFVRKILYPKLQKDYLESEGKKMAKERANVNGVGDEAQENGEPDVDEVADNFPYMALASFAVNHLIRSWQAEGIYAPIADNDPPQSSDEEPTASSSQQMGEGVAEGNGDAISPEKSMIKKALKMHPVLFLNEVAPEVKFECTVAKTSDPPRFEYRCTYKGDSFIGVGKSKKTAKAGCAKQVARSAFHVPYE